jgi:hypothetical protein
VLDNYLFQVLHDCMSKFLATRFNLAKRRRQSTAVEEGIGAKRTLLGAIALLQDEGVLFEQYFGKSPAHQRHYNYFCEQALIPIIEQLKAQIDAVPESDLGGFIVYLDSIDKTALPTNGDRLLDLVLEYSKHKVSS